MLAYFTKATYTNGIYKISDFYTGNNYKLTPNRSLDILLEASDGVVVTKPTTGILGDSTNIRDYTHMLVPSQKKIYRITKFIYVNINQTSLVLEEDPLLSNYIELQSKNIILSRTNDESKFLGMNDMRDLAIEHKATVTNRSLEPNATGTWVLFTFQKDAINLEFEIGEIDNYPSVGTFTSLAALKAAYPRVNTSVPYEVNFYLKFAKVNNDLYQAIYSDEDGRGVSWIKVNKNPTYDYQPYNQANQHVKTIEVNELITISNLGDLSTVNVVFPIEATLMSTSSFYNYSVPSYFSIKSWNNTDKLLSVKIIPEELLNLELEIEPHENTQIVRKLGFIQDGEGGPIIPNNTYELYPFTKSLTSNSLTLYTAGLIVYQVKQFKDIFTFDNWSYLVDTPTDYEPFKNYYLYYYGEMLQIPGRYIKSGFKIRLAITSTDILYEVYTDKMNIIGSGRLMWFTRYAVDQLALFEANNPTYKEQFWTNQISGAIKSIGMGAVGGAVQGGPVGAAAGAALGAVNSVMSTTIASVNMHWMEKGLKDKADQIFGQNDVALTNIKGFGAYLVTIEPETAALNQMKNNYNMSGFPTNTLAKINTLPYETNTVFGSATIIQGQLLEVVKNQNATDEINRILRQGIILVP